MLDCIFNNKERPCGCLAEGAEWLTAALNVVEELSVLVRYGMARYRHTHLRPTGEGHRLGRQVTLNSANLIHEIIFDKLSLHSVLFFLWLVDALASLNRQRLPRPSFQCLLSLASYMHNPPL